MALGSRASLVCVAALAAACTEGAPPRGPEVPRGNLHAFGVRGRLNPTERGARVVPETADDDRTFGVEPGGGVRGVASGVRVVSLPNGAVLAAEDRLPQAPSAAVAIPERLGGGFLFVLDDGTTPASSQLGLHPKVVWRADRWLAPARPIYSSLVPIARVIVGLDRVYLRSANGSHQAIDPRTGDARDLGPWPGSPFVGAYAALDGWRAVAVTDLRGAVATFDAGATWTPLPLPIEPQTLEAVDDAIAIGGLDANRQSAWFELRGGQIDRLPASPVPEVTAPRGPRGAEPSGALLPPGARALGKRPLLAAIEDGWPLEDGTAVVARDGALARVRLEDGALVDLAPDAFPLKPAHCHPVAMPTRADPAAFMFVCGEPRGRTVLYAYDATRARLTELRRFDVPRAVVASGNGALAVRGGCAEDAPSDDESGTQQSYCLLLKDGPWREIRVRETSAGNAPAPPRDASNVADERVVVLADGRVAILSPPHGDPTSARLTILDHERSTTIPVSFGPLQADVLRLLRLGIWLEGFEERRPGVLGGWVEGAGAMLGVEIALDGHAKHGAYIRDAGSPMVSGRYGLGWSASRHGYETTDGGMTWTPIEVPEPLVPDQAVRVRACGPVGCTAKGWLRVGWGAPANAAPAVLPHPLLPAYKPPPWPVLDCEVVGPAIRVPELPTVELHAVVGPWNPWGHTFPNAAAASAGPPPPFFTVPPPALRRDEAAVSVEAGDPLDRLGRSGPLARIYAWGPKGDDWANGGHWQARWLWPYGASDGAPDALRDRRGATLRGLVGDVQSTQAAAAPFATIDAARRALGLPVVGMSVPLPTWALAVGDDAAHALLLGRRGATETTILELESDRPPLELRRLDGEPFGEVDAAVRTGGHWYLLGPQGTGELPASVIWQVDGVAAREIARVPRAAGHGPTSADRLARRSDGRAIGIVVDGQPPPDRSAPVRWILPVDIESAVAGEPEALGANDLSDRAEAPPCDPRGLHGEEDEVGWVLDAPWSATARLSLETAGVGKPTPRPAPGAAHEAEATLTNLYARIRLTRGRACLEKLSGTFDPRASGADVFSHAAALGCGPGCGLAHDAPTVAVSALWLGSRRALRCVRREH